MRKNFNCLIRLFAILSLVLMAACSSVTPPGVTPTGTNPAGETQAVTASPSAMLQLSPTSTPFTINTPPSTPTNLPENVVTITFDTMLLAGNTISGDPQDQAPAMQALVKEFEKDHPKVRVVFAPSGYNWPSDNDVFRQAATNTDCFMYADPSQGWQSAEEGDLLDLTPFLDASPGLKDDFFPAFLDTFHIDGKWYGLPAAVQLNYIAYNADLLAQKGISFPKPGWRVDDLLAFATQAANPSASKPIYGFGDDNAYIFHTLGVPWYDANVQPPQGTFTNDQMVKAFTWIKDLTQKGTLYPYSPTSLEKYQGFMNAISGGQVAFWPTDGWRNFNLDPWTALAHPIYDQNLPFKVGYVPFPLLSSGKAMSDYLNLVGYYISSHTTHAKATACWDWIQFLSAQPNIFGGFSPRPSILPSEDLGQDPARFAVVQAAIQQFNHDAYLDMGKPLLDPYTEELYSSLRAIAAGADVSVTLAGAQSRSDAYAACIAQKDLTGLYTPQIYKLVQGCYTPPQTTPQP